MRSGAVRAVYSSSDIIRIIKPRRLRWVGHMACMGEKKHTEGFGWESRKKDTTLETGRRGESNIKMDIKNEMVCIRRPKSGGLV